MRAAFFSWTILLVITPAVFGATEDSGISRLLSKLPPPEKVVRPQDPIVNDPVTKKILQEINAHNFGRALDLSRQLSRAHREDAIAHGLHGWIAFMVHQFSESTSEFRTAIKLQPSYGFGYAGLAYSEAVQGRYTNALQDFQRLARLQPDAEIAWIGSSQCAEQLGHRPECLAYARRATDLAPRSSLAWMQLARAEDLVGDKRAAQRALTRAHQLGAANPRNG